MGTQHKDVLDVLHFVVISIDSEGFLGLGVVLVVEELNHVGQFVLLADQVDGLGDLADLCADRGL